ncbi:MAG: HNH endonuclease [Bacteroidetes bacterium]|nr:MAG: HNH endonuclease [Bacteroidota bacterium]
MRPISNAPTPQIEGINKSFSSYQEWRADLVNAYGQHCVYCNDRLQSNLQVEHKIAQSLGIVNSFVWDNLSLACGPCNLAKSNNSIKNSYFPNEHNTHLIFEYKIQEYGNKYACIPIPSKSLAESQKEKAYSTIKLTELNRTYQNGIRKRKMTDVRWLNRYDAYQVCKNQRYLWDSLETQNQISIYLASISPIIIKTGFFSLWVSEFKNVPEVLRVIIDTLPSTSKSCFDSNFNPIPRNPQNTNDPI